MNSAKALPVSQEGSHRFCLSVRSQDSVGCYGGEEFVLLVKPCSASTLSAIAEKLCVQVAENIRFNDQRITVSIGTAKLRPGETPEQWFIRADAALYRAKKAGRNRVVNINETGLNAVRPPLV